MAVDTTDPEYWLNWRFFLCALWVYSCMGMACFLIWKYEGPSSPDRDGSDGGDGEEPSPQVSPGVVYLEDCWKSCLEEVHPGWLLVFRLVAFFILASLLAVDFLTDGWSIFLYYTQWTFLLVTLYFGLGSLLSIYGCYQYAYKTGGDRYDLVQSDADHGTYITVPAAESASDPTIKVSYYTKTNNGREVAGFWGYMFQIMFQTNAGAVMITDLVFWFILYPFLAHNEYHMDFILIGTHSINVVFIIGDAALNKLHFPWFRIAYFLLWTGIFVNIQWIVHANVSMWWPYPFLDLTFPGAPVWYLVVALLHLPCYALFVLVLRIKHSLLESWFPQTYVK
ncbi:hypothetical protein BS78_03G048700 [Paspalum vaginatum]|nr:hypothetical protein BS78_03G048700 [Paspalum vaginatum]KAJ1282397.1 hypothetical protein BS78_03G048700 [Paspalum vaginatum]KAJ1282398.1 hypothetical protein BS78_03G048700 [Paspalum vaginatum]